MAPYLRLRQVCLVAADLKSAVVRIQESLGLTECYRDPNVARYGLENVLFPIGNNLVEIVAPTRPEPVFAGVVLEAVAPATVDLCGVRFRLEGAIAHRPPVP